MKIKKGGGDVSKASDRTSIANVKDGGRMLIGMFSTTCRFLDTWSKVAMSASMTACSDCTAFSVSSFAIAVSCLTLVTLLAVPTLYTSASFLRASTASATSLFVWPSILVISISASFFLIRMSCIVMSSIASTRLFCGNSPRSCRSASVAKPVSSSFITLVEHPPPQRRLSATFFLLERSTRAPVETPYASTTARGASYTTARRFIISS